MNPIDIQKLADEVKFNRFHAVILIWCALIIVFDGYDLVIAGVAMPAIMQDLKVNAAQAGLMASSALIGMSFGAIVLGTLADRIGRRWVIAICLALFSIFTAAAGLARDPATFSLLRFVAGFGIGGVMPCVIALTTEYSPRRIRSTLVTLMMCGYAVGGMLVAWLGKETIVQHGWQMVFFAAITPVVLIPFVLRWLPESMSRLAHSNRQDVLRSIACRLDPVNPPPASAVFVMSENRTGKVPVQRLFTEGRILGTLMLWVTYFMCLFMIYALGAWLPKLMADAGHSLSSAMIFVMVLNFGSIIGALGGGWLADHFLRIKYVLVVMCLLAFASIYLLGQPLSTALLYFIVGLAGATAIGTQTVTHACTGQFYPTTICSTGLGWALGVGRIGAIIAPILIGILVNLSLKLELNFLVIALPALIAAVAVSFVEPRPTAAKILADSIQPTPTRQ